MNFEGKEEEETIARPSRPKAAYSRTAPPPPPVSSEAEAFDDFFEPMDVGEEELHISLNATDAKDEEESLSDWQHFIKEEIAKVGKENADAYMDEMEGIELEVTEDYSYDEWEQEGPDLRFDQDYKDKEGEVDDIDVEVIHYSNEEPVEVETVPDISKLHINSTDPTKTATPPRSISAGVTSKNIGAKFSVTSKKSTAKTSLVKKVTKPFSSTGENSVNSTLKLAKAALGKMVQKFNRNSNFNALKKPESRSVPEAKENHDYDTEGFESDDLSIGVDETSSVGGDSFAEQFTRPKTAASKSKADNHHLNSTARYLSSMNHNIAAPALRPKTSPIKKLDPNTTAANSRPKTSKQSAEKRQPPVLPLKKPRPVSASKTRTIPLGTKSSDSRVSKPIISQPTARSKNTFNRSMPLKRPMLSSRPTTARIKGSAKLKSNGKHRSQSAPHGKRYMVNHGGLGCGNDVMHYPRIERIAPWLKQEKILERDWVNSRGTSVRTGTFPVFQMVLPPGPTADEAPILPSRGKTDRIRSSFEMIQQQRRKDQHHLTKSRSGVDALLIGSPFNCHRNTRAKNPYGTSSKYFPF